MLTAGKRKISDTDHQTLPVVPHADFRRSNVAWILESLFLVLYFSVFFLCYFFFFFFVLEWSLWTYNELYTFFSPLKCSCSTPNWNFQWALSNSGECQQVSASSLNSWPGSSCHPLWSIVFVFMDKALIKNTTDTGFV